MGDFHSGADVLNLNMLFFLLSFIALFNIIIEIDNNRFRRGYQRNIFARKWEIEFERVRVLEEYNFKETHNRFRRGITIRRLVLSRMVPYTCSSNREITMAHTAYLPQYLIIRD